MSTPADSPAAVLSPIQAALALQLAAKVTGIAQLRVLLHLIAHPWPMTSDEIRQLLGVSQTIAWMHLTKLVNLGLVIISGKDEAPGKPGAKKLLYQVKGASS